MPVLEMDEEFQMPGWRPRRRDEFVSVLKSFVEQDRWIVDGNYASQGAAEIVWPEADTFVWLDKPRIRTTWRVFKRTAARSVTRQKLWNGNRESVANLIKTDPEDNIVLWAWTRHNHYRLKYESAMTDGLWGHAVVHRLRSDDEVKGFLRDLVSD
jgi:adenylate kinase family enzyme